MKPFEWKIAIRFLIKGRFQTIFIILGISIGVAVQFFLSSLIGGLQKSLIERTVGNTAHIIVQPESIIPLSFLSNELTATKEPVYRKSLEIISWQKYYEYFKSRDGVKVVLPVINGQGFIERGDAIYSTLIKGVQLEEAKIFYKFNKNIISGEAKLAGESSIIGKDLADNLKLKNGDTFYLRNESGNSIVLTVSAIIDLGSSLANNIVLISIDRARSFLNINGVSGIDIQIFDVFKANDLANEWKREFSRIKIESWQERNKELLTALRSQSSSSYIIQFFVVLSISLGIASVLGISAIQKSRQLGILKALGVNDVSSFNIFLIMGALLGLVGSVFGVLLGFFLAFGFIYGAKGVSFSLDINMVNILMPVILSLFSSIIASVFPANNAKRLSPIEVIRNG
ncbi:MAG: ABC transporter permease [Brevinematales bacterium]|nr:ABC transporter permease [Brevinematales bacterium]